MTVAAEHEQAAVTVGGAWGVPDSDSSRQPSAGRRFVLLSPETEQVSADVCRESLPSCGHSVGPDGRTWRRFELPAFGLYADAGTDVEPIELSIFGSRSGRSTAIVEVSDQLLRYRDDADDGMETLPPPQQGMEADLGHRKEASELAIRTIDGHLHFVHEIRDGAFPRDVCWEGIANGMVFVSVDHALEVWAAVDKSDEPRRALIVQLAEVLPDLLTDVCARPRKILTRVREIQAAGRVQQVDSGCLRWLARQPGRTVAEKAGPRQRVLAVVRRENSDTPENRVIRDLLVRALHAANRYLREYRENTMHARVMLVLRFRRLLRQLLNDSEISTVRPLVGIAQPNYVLQHDPRYRPLWKEYVRLVNQQLAEDSVWRWRHRLWAEHCLLATASSLHNLSAVSSAGRSDLLIHDEQERGQFIDGRSCIASWELNDHRTTPVDLVPNALLEKYPLIPPAVLSLSPDFVLVSRDPARGSVVVAVFTSFDFGLGGPEAESLIDDLDRALPRDVARQRYRAILIRPGRNAGQADSCQIKQHRRVASVQITPPLQQRLTHLGEIMTWALQQN